MCARDDPGCTGRVQDLGYQQHSLHALNGHMKRGACVCRLAQPGRQSREFNTNSHRKNGYVLRRDQKATTKKGLTNRQQK